jgi:hypothetical protein
VALLIFPFHAGHSGFHTCETQAVGRLDKDGDVLVGLVDKPEEGMLFMGAYLMQATELGKREKSQ